MARKKQSEIVETDTVDNAALEKGTQAMAAHSANAAAVAEMIGYEGPYVREQVVQEARFFMGQSAEAMLEAGKRLLLLKENEGHGDFLDILEQRLGMEPRVAQKMMQAAAKYLTNPAIGANAKALSHLGKTKLYEMMVMDDDDIVEIAAGGTINGLNLDAIDQMTTRELKEALRESTATQAATEKVLAGKNQKIDRLTTQLERRREETPAEEWEWGPFRRSVIDRGEELSSLIQTQFHKAFLEAQEHADAGNGMPPDVESLFANVMTSVMQSLVAVQNTFNINVDLDAVVTPAWLTGQAD